MKLKSNIFSVHLYCGRYHCKQVTCGQEVHAHTRVHTHTPTGSLWFVWLRDRTYQKQMSNQGKRTFTNIQPAYGSWANAGIRTVSSHPEEESVTVTRGPWAIIQLSRRSVLEQCSMSSELTFLGVRVTVGVRCTAFHLCNQLLKIWLTFCLSLGQLVLWPSGQVSPTGSCHGVRENLESWYGDAAVLGCWRHFPSSRVPKAQNKQIFSRLNLIDPDIPFLGASLIWRIQKLSNILLILYWIY
jgi:hypothetical protein